MPVNMWPEAIDVMTYITGYVPHKAIKDQIPNELWFGEKQSIEHLRV